MVGVVPIADEKVELSGGNGVGSCNDTSRLNHKGSKATGSLWKLMDGKYVKVPIWSLTWNLYVQFEFGGIGQFVPNTPSCHDVLLCLIPLLILFTFQSKIYSLSYLLNQFIYIFFMNSYIYLTLKTFKNLE